MKPSTVTVKRIRILSAARIAGAIGAASGLLAGLFVALLSLAGFALPLAAEGGEGSEKWVALALGTGSIVVLPLVYGAVGALAGVVQAFVYNVVAGLFGGLRLDLE